MTRRGRLAGLTVVVAGLIAGPVPMTTASGTVHTRSAPEAGVWKQISVGTFHTCGIKLDGTLWCWGANTLGQLGAGNHRTRSTPLQVGHRADWTFVTGGHDLTCAIPADGTLWCWGTNDDGQVGTGDGTPIVRRPVQIGTATDWVSVDGSDGGPDYSWDHHACGVRGDGTLWCWGQNDTGQLGIGTLDGALTPTQVGHSHAWVQVSAGDLQTCGLRSDGSLWCWGNTYLHGEAVESLRPLRIGHDQDWAKISVGGFHLCGLKLSGTLWCWGYNNNGQLGDGTQVNHFSKEQVGDSTQWLDVTAAYYTTCGVTADGKAWCWGQGLNGALGDGGRHMQTVPTQVVGGPAAWAAAPSTRHKHGCALGMDGSGWCWGYNGFGEVGNGTHINAFRPVQILD